jgi:hypothetical protein
MPALATHSPPKLLKRSVATDGSANKSLIDLFWSSCMAVHLGYTAGAQAE